MCFNVSFSSLTTLSSSPKTRSKYENEKAQWRKERAEFRATIDTLTEELTQVTSESVALRRELSHDSSEMDDLSRSAQRREWQLQRTAADLQSLTGSNAKLSHSNALLESQLQQSDARYRSLQQKYSELQSDYLYLRSIYSDVMQHHENVLQNLQTVYAVETSSTQPTQLNSAKSTTAKFQTQKQQIKGTSDSSALELVPSSFEFGESGSSEPLDNGALNERMKRAIESSLASVNETLRFEYKQLQSEHWKQKFEALQLERENLRQHQALVKAKLQQSASVSTMPLQSATNQTTVSASKRAKGVQLITDSTQTATQMRFQKADDSDVSVDCGIQVEMAAVKTVERKKRTLQSPIVSLRKSQMQMLEFGASLRQLQNGCVQTRFEFTNTCQSIAQILIAFGSFVEFFSDSLQCCVKRVNADLKQTRVEVKCELEVMANVIQNAMVAMAKRSSDLKESSLLSEMKRFQSAAYVTRVDESRSPPSGWPTHSHTHALTQLEKRAVAVSDLIEVGQRRKSAAQKQSLATLVQDFVDLGGLNRVPALASDFKHEPLFQRKNRFRFGTRYIEIVASSEGLYVQLTHNRTVPLREFVDKHGPVEINKLLSQKAMRSK